MKSTDLFEATEPLTENETSGETVPLITEPVKKIRKKREPLTPERKAQLAEQLKRGRATSLEKRRIAASLKKIEKENQHDKKMEEQAKKITDHLNKKNNKIFLDEIEKLKSELRRERMKAPERQLKPKASSEPMVINQVKVLPKIEQPKIEPIIPKVVAVEPIAPIAPVRIAYVAKAKRRY